MDEPVVLRTDGPHSPEYTKQVADTLAEAVRVCNYATLGDAPGLERVQDAYSLLASLYIGTGRLPQLCAQLGVFLGRQRENEHLAADDDGSPGVLLYRAIRQLDRAAEYARGLTEALQDAQNAIAGLYVKDAGNA